MKLKRALPALLLAAAASTAHAVRPPDHLTERALEVAGGPRARAARAATWTPPTDEAAKAWTTFLAARGAWSAQWDADTGVATTVWGEGIAAPGASADAAIAAAAATEIVAAHLDLLAPGVAITDLVIGKNVVGPDGIRTVAFAQHADGMAVVGGGVTVSFKHDRAIVLGSTVSPKVAARRPAQVVDAATAEASARAWIEQVHGGAPKVVGAAGAPVVLPIVRRADHTPAVEHRVVVPVTVDLASPRGLWTVYVDAHRGAPVARRQRLAFAEGTVRYRVPEREPTGTRLDYPATRTRHTVDGAFATSDLGGVVTWAGDAAATVTPGLLGPLVRVYNAAGPIATATLTLDPAGEVVWDLSTDQLADAQLTAFIHAGIAKQFALTTLNPDLGWLSQQISVTVNEDGVCNAYSNLDDIHFFPAGGGCENTARLADVVYHEFGHSLHGQSIVHFGDFDGALSEGISDYLAATITGDPAMGIGFMDPGEPLRHIDPEGREHVYPDDFFPDLVHDSGLIIGGTLWDLRKLLTADLGEAAGVALADDIFYAVISRSVDIPASFPEALAVDDDDGNLANGTPNECAIIAAFGMHGLAPADVAYGLVAPPTLAGRSLTIDQLGENGGRCANAQITSGEVTWRVRGDADTTGTIALAEAGDAFTGELPEVEDGTVLQYQVRVTLDDGSSRTFPTNNADPWYETYVGPVSVLQCLDFEADPAAAGWNLDGFQWGQPMAPDEAGDPTTAFSGSYVIGTDLGGSGADGKYQPNATSTATSPVYDVTAYPNVRLQFRRWLTTEDAVFDPAYVLVDGARLWSSPRGNGGLTFRDREWRFQDLDLSPLAQNGMVQVAFQLVADGQAEYGGWNVDDVCLVVPGPPVCGDGLLGGDEACDDGNDADGDGCSSTCALDEPEPEPEPTDPGGCCSTGRGGASSGVILAAAVLFGLRRRRARA